MSESVIRRIMPSQEFFTSKEFISTARAAKRFGRTRDYVSRLARDGEVIAKRAGKKWVVDPDSLAAFIVAQEEAKADRAAELVRLRKEEYARAQGLALPKEEPKVERTPIPKRPARIPKERYMPPLQSELYQSVRQELAKPVETAAEAASIDVILPLSVEPDVAAAPVASAPKKKSPGRPKKQKAEAPVMSPIQPDDVKEEDYRTAAVHAAQVHSALWKAVDRQQPQALTHAAASFYTISPVGDLLHKLGALLGSVALVLAGYALVDHDFARYAAETLYAHGQILAISTYESVNTVAAVSSGASQVANAALANPGTVEDIAFTSGFDRLMTTLVSAADYAISFAEDILPH